MDEKKKYGYDVILSLRYTKEIKFESEKVESMKVGAEEVKEHIKKRVIQDILDIQGGKSFLEQHLKVVRLERNGSESTFKLAPWELSKKYIVSFSARYSGIDVTLMAECEEDALALAEKEMTTHFISEDGKTDCEVFKYELSDVSEVY